MAGLARPALMWSAHKMFGGRCQGICPMCERGSARIMAAIEGNSNRPCEGEVTRMHKRNPRLTRVGMATVVVALTVAASAMALQALPPGAQVNDDPAAGIDKAKAVDGGEPTNADVVGGALIAGKPGVPWATFRQQTSGADQVFARSFAGGAWTTGDRHRRWALERQLHVPRLAELRPGRRRRGAGDRLR